MARIASATGASSHDLDLTSPPLPPDQGIELAEYPLLSDRAGSSHQSRPRFSDPASERDPASITETKERVGQERGGDPQRHHLYSRPLRLKHWVEVLRNRSQCPGGNGLDAKMKFSHSIQFNAVPEWSSYYIAYSNLKKV